MIPAYDRNVALKISQPDNVWRTGSTATMILVRFRADRPLVSYRNSSVDVSQLIYRFIEIHE